MRKQMVVNIANASPEVMSMIFRMMNFTMSVIP